MFRSIARFFVGLCVGSVVVLAFNYYPDRDASASHPYSPNQRLQGLHNSPGGQISYSMCTDDPATQQVWSWGAETWEAAMLGDMTFNAIPSCVSASVIFQYEYSHFCSTGAYACLE